MFVKLQHLDANCCFQTLSSKNAKISFKAGVSVTPLENLEQATKNQKSQQHVFECPNDGVTKEHATSVHRHQTLGGNHRSFVHGPDKTQGGVKNPEFRIERRGKFGLKLWSDGRQNGVLEKQHTKRSKKWVRYGGCIPAILEALEAVSDLDEAFKPWEMSLSNKERSIILKEQSDWERAMGIFEWFKKKGYYEVNVIHYNIMLRMLGKAQRWNEVEMLWDEMGKRGVVPINSTYGTLIDVYSKAGLKEEALRWLTLMNERRMEPDEVTMGTVVQLYKKAGEFLKAEQFFKKWSSDKYAVVEGKISGPETSKAHNGSQANISLSLYTYNTLIDTYGKAGQLKEVSETFKKMLREGIVPTTVTFNTMIHICGNNGQLEEVASLMKKMDHLGCLPDTRTYNILISLYAKHDDIETAENYFTMMKEASLEPDLVSYRTLLYAFSVRHSVNKAEVLVCEVDERGLEIDEFTQTALTRMYIEAGMLKKSWLWFKRFHLKGNMTSECYSANIDAFGERGHVLEAESVFSCCQVGGNLSVLEFNVMIKAYGISKRYDDACRLFDRMGTHGIVPDKCSYNSLIQMLAGADLPQKAKTYLKKMLQAGFVNDCIPHCAVISSFARVGQLEEAVGVFNEMIGFNVQPDAVAYGVLINAFADVGNVKEAQGYADAMRKKGLPMNDVIHNSLIKLYTKVGYLKEAQETYKVLQSFEEGPDVFSSNCMIDLYTERSMVRQAEEIFEIMKRKGDANEFSYAMMLCMYKKIGRFEEAILIAKKMRELGLLTDLLSYNQVLDLYSSYGRIKQAATTFNEMIKSAIKPDTSTIKSLGVVLIKCGIPKQAVGKLEVMWKRDDQSGLQAWMSTLSSVLGFGENVDSVDETWCCGSYIPFENF